MHVRTARERGAVLIITVGVLAVLLLVAISFARLMVVERDVSKNHREYVQARMAAESGIEHAIAWFRDQSNFRPADGMADPVSRQWIFKNNTTSDVGAGRVELAESQAPSFQIPHVVPCSGVVPDVRYSYDRNFYKLKIIDTHSQINLNGPEEVVRKQLANLGQALQLLSATFNERPDWWRPSYGAVPNPFPSTPPAGDDPIDRLIALRNSLPAQIFTSKEQIKTDAAGNTLLNANSYRLVEDLLSVRGWQNDRTVAFGAPNIQLGNTGLTYWVWWRRPSLWWKKTAAIQTVVTKLQPRYPININTAPKAVLIANLLNLSSFRRRLRPGNPATIASGGLSGTYSSLIVDHGANIGDLVGPLTFVKAKILADAIIAYRNNGAMGPFREWQQFMLFINRQGILTPDEKALIIANCCPNQMSNFFLPEPQRYFSVSKDMQFGPTSEFCFNSNGFFEITSLGWVQDNNARILAEVELATEVKLWHVIHRGSQRDWLGTVQFSQNTVTGPESIYNTIRSTATNAADPLLQPTYGNQNVAANGSPYEGWIQPLTEYIQITGGGYQGRPTFRFNGTPRSFQTFYAPFAYDATALPFDALGRDSFGRFHTVGNRSAGGEGGGFQKRAGETIFRGEALAPDGVLFQSYSDEELSYDVVNNFNPQLGTIEFYIKLMAGWDPARGGSGYGAHEPLFYMTQLMTPQGQSPAYGVTWKLERYGYTLRSTRFVWMNPIPPVLQPIPINAGGFTYLWTEKSWRINGRVWRDNEWHHIAHSWNGFTDQSFWVDGLEAGALFGQFQITPAPGTTTRLELVSVDPQLRAFAGGFIYNKTSAAGVFNGVNDTTGTVVRVGNCKIDEIRAYQFFVPASGGALAGRGILSSKFDTRIPGGSRFIGAIPIDVDGEIAQVTFTALYPTQYSNWSFISGDQATTRSTMQIRYSLSANGQSFQGTDSGRLSQARSYTVRSGQPLRYQIDFAQTAANYAPVVDDVTIYILVPPTYFGYRQNFDR